MKSIKSCSLQYQLSHDPSGLKVSCSRGSCDRSESFMFSSKLMLFEAPIDL